MSTTSQRCIGDEFARGLNPTTSLSLDLSLRGGDMMSVNTFQVTMFICALLLLQIQLLMIPSPDLYRLPYASFAETSLDPVDHVVA